MKKLTILIAVTLAISSCSKDMPVPDSYSGTGNLYYPGTSDPSDPGQAPYQDPYYDPGDGNGYYSGDDGSDDSGDYGDDDSGDDSGDRYKAHAHHAANPAVQSAAKVPVHH